MAVPRAAPVAPAMRMVAPGTARPSTVLTVPSTTLGVGATGRGTACAASRLMTVANEIDATAKRERGRRSATCTLLLSCKGECLLGCQRWEKQNRLVSHDSAGGVGGQGFRNPTSRKVPEPGERDPLRASGLARHPRISPRVHASTLLPPADVPGDNPSECQPAVVVDAIVK